MIVGIPTCRSVFYLITPMVNKCLALPALNLCSITVFAIKTILNSANVCVDYDQFRISTN